jgi:Cu/Ag efflux pump CusA
VTWGGQFRLQQEANARLALVIPITLLFILLLLFASLGSFRSSVLILLNIPLALVGGVVALALTGQNLSVPASVGFIALFGVALGNAMVLVTPKAPTRRMPRASDSRSTCASPTRRSLSLGYMVCDTARRGGRWSIPPTCARLA